MKLLKYSPKSWVCSSCEALSKLLKEVHLGDIELIEVDIDTLSPSELKSLGIRGVPVLRLVDELGVEVKRMQGLPSLTKLQEFLMD